MSESRATKPGVPEPPEHLSERAKGLWREVVPRRALSPGRLALLQTALEALDRAEECRVAIGRDGLVSKTETTGAVHVHPLLKAEKDSRQLFARLWTALDLQWDFEVDGQAVGRVL